MEEFDGDEEGLLTMALGLTIFCTRSKGATSEVLRGRTRMNSCFLRSCAIIMDALCVFAPAFGQEVPDDCGALCVCVVDATCSDASGCDLTGCETTQFTLNCTSGGIYKFEVFLSCADCEHCLACAFVTDPQGGWTGILQAGCIANQCNAIQYITLAGGTTYKLSAGLRRCGTPNTCTGCSGCTAKARVYRYTSDCGTACNW
jgi:hypothetical protein